MKWYLLQTKPNAYLRAFENLQNQGFDVFCPLIIKTTKKRNKFINQTVPLFQGYIFMGARSEPIPWPSINGTRGISKAVTLDGTYKPVNNKIITGLKQRCNKNSIIQKIDDIEQGDRVKIERGPFADFICNVDQIADNRRAWVLINLLQKKTKTKISLDDLSKIN